MSIRATLLITFLLINLPNLLFAATEVRKFNSDEKKKLYYELTSTLRCQVCANQSIADSNVQVARSLRNVVYSLVSKGQNETQILTYLTSRFGEKISYNPRVRAGTFILWFGPLLILFFIFPLILKKIKRNSAETENKNGTHDVNQLNAEEVEILNKIKAQSTNDKH